MCRNIKRLRRATPPAGEAECAEAARHLVRKLSGFQEPSALNRDVFDKAVETVTRHSLALLRAIRPEG